jgi:hypothetical protein
VNHVAMFRKPVVYVFRSTDDVEGARI